MKQHFGMSLLISGTHGNKKVKVKGQYYLQKSWHLQTIFIFQTDASMDRHVY